MTRFTKELLLLLRDHGLGGTAWFEEETQHDGRKFRRWKSGKDIPDDDGWNALKDAIQTKASGSGLEERLAKLENLREAARQGRIRKQKQAAGKHRSNRTAHLLTSESRKQSNPEYSRRKEENQTARQEGSGLKFILPFAPEEPEKKERPASISEHQERAQASTGRASFPVGPQQHGPRILQTPEAQSDVPALSPWQRLRFDRIKALYVPVPQWDQLTMATRAVLTGETGSGKTATARELLRRALEQGRISQIVEAYPTDPCWLLERDAPVGYLLDDPVGQEFLRPGFIPWFTKMWTWLSEQRQSDIIIACIRSSPEVLDQLKKQSAEWADRLQKNKEVEITPPRELTSLIENHLNRAPHKPTEPQVIEVCKYHIDKLAQCLTDPLAIDNFVTFVFPRLKSPLNPQSLAKAAKACVNSEECVEAWFRLQDFPVQAFLAAVGLWAGTDWMWFKPRWLKLRKGIARREPRVMTSDDDPQPFLDKLVDVVELVGAAPARIDFTHPTRRRGVMNAVKSWLNRKDILTVLADVELQDSLEWSETATYETAILTLKVWPRAAKDADVSSGIARKVTRFLARNHSRLIIEMGRHKDLLGVMNYTPEAPDQLTLGRLERLQGHALYNVFRHEDAKASLLRAAQALDGVTERGKDQLTLAELRAARAHVHDHIALVSARWWNPHEPGKLREIFAGFDNALHLAQSSGDSWRQSEVLAHIGSTRRRCLDWDGAVKSLMRSIELRDRLSKKPNPVSKLEFITQGVVIADLIVSRTNVILTGALRLRIAQDSNADRWILEAEAHLERARSELRRLGEIRGTSHSFDATIRYAEAAIRLISRQTTEALGILEVPEINLFASPEARGHAHILRGVAFLDTHSANRAADEFGKAKEEYYRVSKMDAMMAETWQAIAFNQVAGGSDNARDCAERAREYYTALDAEGLPEGIRWLRTELPSYA